MVNDTFPTLLVFRRIAIDFAWETVIPDAEHAVTITVTILSSPSDDRDTMPTSSAYDIPYNLCTSSSPFLPHSSRLCLWVKCPSYPLSFFRWSRTTLSVMAASARKLSSATRGTAVKNTLNIIGATMLLYHMHCTYQCSLDYCCSMSTVDGLWVDGFFKVVTSRIRCIFCFVCSG